jgi:energy-coupling factor transporter ATP-binding protein EcfA2
MVLVSHDMRLISQVAQEIWVVDNHTVMKYMGEINDFKMQIRAQMQRGGIMQGNDSASTVQAPILVPLAPRSTFGAASAVEIPSIAPPAAAPAPKVISSRVDD